MAASLDRSREPRPEGHECQDCRNQRAMVEGARGMGTLHRAILWRAVGRRAGRQFIPLHQHCAGEQARLGRRPTPPSHNGRRQGIRRRRHCAWRRLHQAAPAPEAFHARLPTRVGGLQERILGHRKRATSRASEARPGQTTRDSKRRRRLAVVDRLAGVEARSRHQWTECRRRKERTPPQSQPQSLAHRLAETTTKHLAGRQRKRRIAFEKLVTQYNTHARRGHGRSPPPNGKP